MLTWQVPKRIAWKNSESNKTYKLSVLVCDIRNADSDLRNDTRWNAVERWKRVSREFIDQDLRDLVLILERSTRVRN